LDPPAVIPERRRILLPVCHKGEFRGPGRRATGRGGGTGGTRPNRGGEEEGSGLSKARPGESNFLVVGEGKRKLSGVQLAEKVSYQHDFAEVPGKDWEEPWVSRKKLKRSLGHPPSDPEGASDCQEE